MASLAVQAKQLGVSVKMVTNDKDVAQVVEDGDAAIQQVLFFKNETWGEAEVKEKFGVRTSQVIDYLSMIGDSVDNIKGIDGVGPKSAQALLNTYENLDEIYENIDSIPQLKIRGAKSLQQKLIRGKESVFQAREMIELRTDLDFEFDDLLEELEYHGPNEDDVGVYQNLGFTQPFRELLRHYNIHS